MNSLPSRQLGGYTPFEVFCGWAPQLDTLRKTVDSLPAMGNPAERRLVEKSKLFIEVREHIQGARDKGLEYANRGNKRTMSFKTGELVLLKVINSLLPKGYSEKIVPDYSPCRSGLPFVVKEVNLNTCTAIIIDPSYGEGEAKRENNYHFYRLLKIPDDVDYLPKLRPSIRVKLMEGTKAGIKNIRKAVVDAIELVPAEPRRRRWYLPEDPLGYRSRRKRPMRRLLLLLPPQNLSKSMISLIYIQDTMIKISDRGAPPPPTVFQAVERGAPRCPMYGEI